MRDWLVFGSIKRYLKQESREVVLRDAMKLDDFLNELFYFTSSCFFIPQFFCRCGDENINRDVA